jgi:hypothetical protein
MFKNSFSVQPLANGRFGIFNGTTLVRDYSRARDARRGMVRMSNGG